MRVVVIHESLTGNTARAGRLIAERLRQAGAEAIDCPITDIDYQALSAADLVVIGSWTDGIFVVGQRPGRAGRIKAMPVIAGKKAAVFCTYALNAGHVLEKLQAIVEQRGGEVVGGMTIRRDRIDEGVETFVDRLMAAVPA